MATPRKPKTKAAAPEKGKTAPTKPKPTKKSASVVQPTPAAKASAKSAPAPATKPTAKSKSAPVARVEPPPRVQAPPPPRKLTDSDREWMVGIRDMLIKRRDELNRVVNSNQAQLKQKSTDSADVSDRASEGFEDELAMGLIAIEAAQLEDIEDAIRRIDDESYGLCATCTKPIPRKRLEVLPFAKRCITCEGTVERMPRAQSAYEEESND